jgi:hypothetical protein
MGMRRRRRVPGGAVEGSSGAGTDNDTHTDADGGSVPSRTRLGPGREAAGQEGTRRHARHARRSRRWLLATAALGVIVVGLVTALALTAALGGDGADRSLTGADGPTDVVSYQDPQGRFGLSYPTDWSQVPPSATDVALLLRAGSR